VSRLAVAIPTRNRADLAMAAIGSVLRSAQPDVTVVVSDNSSDELERDRLERFCARQPADAVKYVRPPEPLDMTKHWEWLRRLIQERDEHTHLTYLTDRMVFTAGSLGELTRTIERQPEQVVSYHHDRVEDASAPVELVQTQWTGGLLELDSRRLIEMSSRGAWGDHLPRMLNCVVPVSTMAAIEERFGSVFASVSPDYCFAYRCLDTCGTILYLDRACLIEYGMGRSAGTGYRKGKLNEDALSFRVLSVPHFGATPEPAFETTANAIYQEYCTVRDEAGGDRFPNPDWASYLATTAISVGLIQDAEWRARMQRLLRDRGWTRRRSARHALSRAAAIARYFVRHPGALARSLRRQLWDRPPGTPLANLLPRVGLDARVRDDLKFESAADAIAYANAHPRTRTPYAWHVHQLRRAGAIVRSL
jgi:hypothetical protein